MKSSEQLSSLELAVLAQIYIRPASGYEIRKVFADTPFRQFSSSPGAIYPVLKRLEGMGLVCGTVEQADTLRPKKVYEVSDDGARNLREHVAQPVTLDDVSCKLDELILRFGLLESLCGLEACEKFLHEFIQHSTQYTQELKKDISNQAQSASWTLSARLSQQFGFDVFAATCAWAQMSLKQVTAKRSEQNRQETKRTSTEKSIRKALK